MKRIKKFIGGLVTSLCMFPIKVFGYEADYTISPMYGVCEPDPVSEFFKAWMSLKSLFIMLFSFVLFLELEHIV